MSRLYGLYGGEGMNAFRVLVWQHKGKRPHGKLGSDGMLTLK
jgi:hypothetical protein